MIFTDKTIKLWSFAGISLFMYSAIGMELQNNYLTKIQGTILYSLSLGPKTELIQLKVLNESLKLANLFNSVEGDTLCGISEQNKMLSQIRNSEFFGDEICLGKASSGYHALRNSIFVIEGLFMNSETAKQSITMMLSIPNLLFMCGTDTLNKRYMKKEVAGFLRNIVVKERKHKAIFDWYDSVKLSKEKKNYEIINEYEGVRSEIEKKFNIKSFLKFTGQEGNNLTTEDIKNIINSNKLELPEFINNNYFSILDKNSFYTNETLELLKNIKNKLTMPNNFIHVFLINLSDNDWISIIINKISDKTEIIFTNSKNIICYDELVQNLLSLLGFGSHILIKRLTDIYENSKIEKSNDLTKSPDAVNKSMQKDEKKEQTLSAKTLSLKDFSGEIPAYITTIIDAFKNPNIYKQFNEKIKNRLMLYGATWKWQNHFCKNNCRRNKQIFN